VNAPAATGRIPALMAEIADALDAAIRDEIPNLQVTPFLNFNPTPPSLDVYPGDPFQEGLSFTVGDNRLFFTVRARVQTVDPKGGQMLLLRMMDPEDPASVEMALADIDVTVVAGGWSGFREYTDDAATNGRLLACEWRVQVTP